MGAKGNEEAGNRYHHSCEDKVKEVSPMLAPSVHVHQGLRAQDPSLQTRLCTQWVPQPEVSAHGG